MKKREEICDLLNPNSIGCELGVFRGDFSEILLGSNKFSKLYLVDPFYGNIESGDKSGRNIKNYYGDDLFTYVSDRFKTSEIEIKRTDSISFLNSMPDQSLDFIYIDTNHQFDQTVKELEISLKKIRKHGLICGHDYNSQQFYGVVRAVNLFAEKNNLKFELTTEDFLESYIFKI
jgi:hypothetical protein